MSSQPFTGSRFRRTIAFSVVGLLLIAVGLFSPSSRLAVLRAVGRTLVTSDPLQQVDIIVVAIDADGAGALEAADLVHVGLASRVAVFADPPGSINQEFIRRGLPYEDVAARSIRQLESLGVNQIQQIPRTVTGTEDEGVVLPAWCHKFGFQSVLVVTTTDHSRRLRRVMKRAFLDTPTRVAVRPARFSSFDPDRWWEGRNGTRTMIVELQKLIFDVIRHPFA